jgi:hypothetical protein
MFVLREQDGRFVRLAEGLFYHAARQRTKVGVG